MQSDIYVEDGYISGELKYISDPTNQLVQAWGAGNFIALKFTSNADETLVGMDPSQGSGLQPLDSDMNGVFKVTNNTTQKFKVVATKNGYSEIRYFDLKELVLDTE